MSRVMHRSSKTTFPLAVSGQGIELTLADGRTVIDASGGAAVACLGHGNRRVSQAIARQAEKLAYIHTMFFTSEPAEALAELLVGEEKGDLVNAFFVSSGSEAMEASLKLARQYFVEKGEPERLHFISRRQSYHGNTFGALAVSGHPARRNIYEPMLMTCNSQVSPCFAYHYQGAVESDAQYVERLGAELEAEFQAVGPNKVIAFIAETIVGATSGCATALPGYFRKMREVCDRHGALLILDEIMCGMGRSGTTHAWEQEGVTPDLQAVAKGLGGGYSPIGALLVSRKVHDVLSTGTGAFVHGHTYQAHPVACTAALEVQRIIAEEHLVDNARVMGQVLREALQQRFGDHPKVGDLRGKGLFQALEFVTDRDTRTSFSRAAQFSDRLKGEALKLGLAIYPNGGTVDGSRGDHVIIAPPYNINEQQIYTIVDLLGEAVDRTVALVPGA